MDARGSIRDWVIEARRKGLDLDRLDSDKSQDISNLEKLGVIVPTYESINLPYTRFNKDNKSLDDFFNRHAGFVVRAIPAPERPDLRRKPKVGLLNYEECKVFLDEAVKGEENAYNVILSEWAPSKYAGIIISGAREQTQVICEIGRNLTELTFGHEIPLAGFVIDRTKIGHIKDKTKEYSINDPKAKELLWNALRHIRFGDDSFDPQMLRGYFEFIVTIKNDIKFVDYKRNVAYLD